MPSIVLTSRPSASRPSIRHERIERPSTSTAQVPHSPSSHPCFVPVRFRSSRKTSSSVLCGAKATSVCSPLRVKWMCFLLWSGKVFLLHFIQNRVVDQSRFADVRRHSDKRRPLVDAIDFLQRLCVSDCYIIQTGAWFSFDCVTNHVHNPMRVTLAFLESRLRLDEGFVNHGG